MGIEFTHDAWTDGSSSTFNWWRGELAKAAGYPTLVDVAGSDGFADNIVPDLKSSEYEVFKDFVTLTDDEDNTWDRWGAWFEGAPDDILMVLLVWDTKGELDPKYGNELADRIEGLVEKLPKDESPELGGWRKRSREFAAGLRRAAASDESLRVIR